jgi:hypothetical protein
MTFLTFLKLGQHLFGKRRNMPTSGKIVQEDFLNIHVRGAGCDHPIFLSLSSILLNLNFSTYASEASWFSLQQSVFSPAH